MFYSCVGLKILLLQYKYFRQLINHNYGSLLSSASDVRQRQLFQQIKSCLHSRTEALW